MRRQRRNGRHDRLGMPAGDVDDGRPRAAERHVQEVDAGGELEQLHAEMQRAADAAGAILDVAGLGFGERDEFLDRLGRQIRIDRERVRARCEQRDRRKRLQRVVGQLVERRIDRMRDGDDQQRVAVGRRLRHQLGADDAAGAGLVLDDELLAEPLAELRADDARQDVVEPARRERHDHPHRPVRIVVLRGGRREQRQRTCRSPSAIARLFLSWPIPLPAFAPRARGRQHAPSQRPPQRAA